MEFLAHEKQTPDLLEKLQKLDDLRRKTLSVNNDIASLKIDINSLKAKQLGAAFALDQEFLHKKAVLHSRKRRKRQLASELARIRVINVGHVTK